MRNNNLLLTALNYFGLKEVSGSKSNKKILSWIREILPWVKDDSKAAWCGIFMGKVFNDLHIPKPKDHHAAIRWLNVGKKIAPIDIKPGDIVVFYRYSPSDWRSHVGIFVRHSDNGNYLVLGGNQNNEVNIKEYSKSKLRGIRRV